MYLIESLFFQKSLKINSFYNQSPFFKMKRLKHLGNIQGLIIIRSKFLYDEGCRII